MYLIDTHWLSKYLSGDKTLSIEKDEKYYLTRTSLIEYLSYPKFSNEDADELVEIISDIFYIIEIDEEVSDLAATLLRHEEKLELSEALLIAAGLHRELKLLTFNRELLKYYNYLKEQLS